MPRVRLVHVGVVEPRRTYTMSLPQSAHVLGAPTVVLGCPAGGAGAVLGASTWRRLTMGVGTGLLGAAGAGAPPGAGLLQLPPPTWSAMDTTEGRRGANQLGVCFRT